MAAGGNCAPVLAFDVGGTDIKAGILAGPLEPGLPGGIQVRDLQRTPTPLDPAAAGDALVRGIAELTTTYRRNHPDVAVAAVGLTVPGLVDEASGTGIYSANLGWRDYPFRQRLQEATGLPVAFGHDVGTAGEAEFRLGAARGKRDAVVLVIGTGIAGAVFTDGRRVLGGGYAGEIGHAAVPAPDGSFTMLESLGSAGSIARRFRDRSARPANGARGVLELARQGDTDAQAVWQDAMHAIAFGIAQCVAILGTDTVVLGGGLAEAGDALFVPVAARLDELLTFHRRPVLLRAELGQDAGLIGTALKARALLAGTGTGA